MAQITPNMQLTVWNNATDLYDSSQLAQNFITIDDHDHSGAGKGKPVSGANLVPQSVTNAQIAPNTITSGNIGTGQVKEDEIATNAVTTTKIQDNAVTGAKLSNSAINANKFDLTTQQTMGLDIDSGAHRKRYKYIGVESRYYYQSNGWTGDYYQKAAPTDVYTGSAQPADRISNIVVADPGNGGFGVINFAYLALWRRSTTSNSGAQAEIWITNVGTSTSKQVTCPAFIDSASYAIPAVTKITGSASDGGSAWSYYRPLMTVSSAYVFGSSSTTGGSQTNLGSMNFDNGNDYGVNASGLWGFGAGATSYQDTPSTWLTPPSSFSSTDVPFLMPSPVQILVPSGTYNVEIRFRAGSSGNNGFVRNRHMWAWTEAFAAES